MNGSANFGYAVEVEMRCREWLLYFAFFRLEYCLSMKNSLNLLINAELLPSNKEENDENEKNEKRGMFQSVFLRTARCNPKNYRKSPKSTFLYSLYLSIFTVSEKLRNSLNIYSLKSYFSFFKSSLTKLLKFWLIVTTMLVHVQSANEANHYEFTSRSL